MSKLRDKLSYTRIIVLSFLLIILVGAVVLSLPISSRSRDWTPFFDAMFTATSATCVTGMTIYDTYTHWSLFGQFIILLLIQIGGLGVMTCIAMIALFLKRRISLGERRLLMQSAGSLEIGGIVKLIRRIIIGTTVIELFGAVLLSFIFCPKMGFLVGIWNGLFHSISAFCNAGFDLMGRYGSFSSLSAQWLATNPLFSFTISLLIIIGGIGFIVWNDIWKHRLEFKKYEVHSKIVLSSTAILIFSGTILFYIFESGSAFAGMHTGEKLISSLFLSIMPRTAGFNTINLSEMSDSGTLLTALLMFIGGGSGSTAGGIKVTTFVVLLLGALASTRRRSGITIFKRRLDEHTSSQASAVVTVYFTVVFLASMIISFIEPYPLHDILFESVAAISTAGLSKGITPFLSSFSQAVLMFLMFSGRIGGLSLMLVLAERRISIPIDRPTVKILIG
ncbi:MAG: Trk family potassium uptake protein [Clostridiales bacterium]|nr:Trk family potassium uptake protein [Clostridiales bacterium]